MSQYLVNIFSINFEGRQLRFYHFYLLHVKFHTGENIHLADIDDFRYESSLISGTTGQKNIFWGSGRVTSNMNSDNLAASFSNICEKSTQDKGILSNSFI